MPSGACSERSHGWYQVVPMYGGWPRRASIEIYYPVTTFVPVDWGLVCDVPRGVCGRQWSGKQSNVGKDAHTVFVAWRDLKFAKGRFALMGAVIVLITLLVGLLSGLTGGLSQQNISAITGLPD